MFFFQKKLQIFSTLTDSSSLRMGKSPQPSPWISQTQNSSYIIHFLY